MVVVCVVVVAVIVVAAVFCTVPHSHSLQGSLDMQFLANRFQRGKAWAESYTESHHCYMVNDAVGLADAHAALLGFQQANSDAADSFPGLQKNQGIVTIKT